MTPPVPRRTFLKAGVLAFAAPASAADLAPKPAVREKLAALKPNQAALLGKADVVGEFNDTARKYDLHKTGPKGRDFTNNVC